MPSPPSQNSSQASTAASASGALSEEYTETMQARMGSASLVYRHEDGMNYTRILDNLIVGSCPQTAEDIERWAAARGRQGLVSIEFEIRRRSLGPVYEEKPDVPGTAFHIGARVDGSPLPISFARTIMVLSPWIPS